MKEVKRREMALGRPFIMDDSFVLYDAQEGYMNDSSFMENQDVTLSSSSLCNSR